MGRYDPSAQRSPRFFPTRQPPLTSMALASMSGHLALAPYLRAPLSPSMWLSSPSPCMSGTDATKSFKKSNCCSCSMHCFLKEVRSRWHPAGPRCLGSQQGTARSSGCQENRAWKTSAPPPPPDLIPLLEHPAPPLHLQTHQPPTSLSGRSFF